MRRDCCCPRARHSHGTEQAYVSDACRCDECREAHRARMSWRRRMYAYGRDVSGLVPACGAARRLESLALLGWSAAALGERLGWDPVTLHRVRQQPRITAVKHSAIVALFRELWDKPAPQRTKGERISAARTIQLARRRGYLPSLAWDNLDDPDEQPNITTLSPTPGLDEIAVERIMTGSLRLPLHTRADKAPEMIEAIRRLAARGLDNGQIGIRVGRTRDAVFRIRERNNIAPWNGEGAA